MKQGDRVVRINQPDGPTGILQHKVGGRDGGVRWKVYWGTNSEHQGPEYTEERLSHIALYEGPRSYTPEEVDARQGMRLREE